MALFGPVEDAGVEGGRCECGGQALQSPGAPSLGLRRASEELLGTGAGANVAGARLLKCVWEEERPGPGGWDALEIVLVKGSDGHKGTSGRDLVTGPPGPRSWS